MNGEVWANIVSQHDNRLHHVVDVLCALFIGLGLGGLIVYWQASQEMTESSQPTVQLAPQIKSDNTTKEPQGSVQAPQSSTPKSQEI